MNNASLLLNAARPTAATHTSSTGNASTQGASANDATTARNGFDHALDAARAETHQQTATHTAAATHNASDTHKPAANHRDSDTKNEAKAPADKPASKASGTKGDDASTDKDDDADAKDDTNGSGDTSLASSMLALIGVPVQVTQVAAAALGAAKGVATGNPAEALAALTGGKGEPADAAAAAKDGGLNALPAATAGAGDTAAVAASPFATLLATEGATTHAGKDDAKTADLTAASPMPLAHAGQASQANGPVQLQATQAATSPQFSQELGEQISWMSSAAGDVKEARIKLHPEELGSMDVRVNVDGGKVNVAIMAQHPAAVHAVQQTLSNLDSMLAHHGLSLGNAEVNQGGAQQQNGGNPGQGQGGTAGQAETGADTLVTAATSRVSRGLVDEVA
ncbi:flagellar hook-length control protein FliK [Luteibacter aegosomatissinici]|uniref:flagellar hook-length control protein FliK n=1 Tax=Luteibacter aegosomatissinici TaxID=2911539 RepID=UPI001FF824D3|nr:flagellar hook-length control protein FliK [Luteibacter aegosomatissinici]UPG93484.1 flagellar hook-length control protein FliK [Luteibacter aegosomatissinici]